MFIDFREQEVREGNNSHVRNKFDWLPPIYIRALDQTHNLRTCPERESNPQPLGVWDNVPTN